MEIEDIAVLKEKMLIAKNRGNTEEFEKYYKIFVTEYKKITGESFEEKMKAKEDEAGERQLLYKLKYKKVMK